MNLIHPSKSDLVLWMGCPDFYSSICLYIELIGKSFLMLKFLFCVDGNTWCVY